MIDFLDEINMSYGGVQAFAKLYFFKQKNEDDHRTYGHILEADRPATA